MFAATALTFVPVLLPAAWPPFHLLPAVPALNSHLVLPAVLRQAALPTNGKAHLQRAGHGQIWLVRSQIHTLARVFQLLLITNASLAVRVAEHLPRLRFRPLQLHCRHRVVHLLLAILAVDTR